MSVSELKTDARMVVFANSPSLIVVGALYVFITAVVTEFQILLSGCAGVYRQYMERVSGGDPHSVRMLLSFFSPLGTAAAALLFLFAGVLRVGYMGYCLKKSRSCGADYKDIFSGFFFCGKVLLIAAITVALTALWSIAFFFPGVVAYYRYRQAFYILLDDPQKKALQCINESKLLMAGNKTDLFLIDISFLGWRFLSAALTLTSIFVLSIPLPVLSVWVFPYSGIARAAYYDHLLDRAAV